MGLLFDKSVSFHPVDYPSHISLMFKSFFNYGLSESFSFNNLYDIFYGGGLIIREFFIFEFEYFLYVFDG